MAEKMKYEMYLNKVYGGWLGKFIGGTLGGPVEGQIELNDLTYYPRIPTEAAENDDTDFQLVWLHALQERGLHITSEDLVKEWMKHIIYPFNEYSYAMKNFRGNIKPPVSGWFNNDYFMESMGAPIRSEIWGFICPDNPGLAAEYAEKDAVIDHARNGVWAEKFLAAIEAAAFVENNPKKLLDVGLKYIPDKSELFQCMKDVSRWCEQYQNWKFTRQLILDKYGHPDPTDVIQNLAIVGMSLLYGKNNFEKAILLALNSGYDTDCTCATVGAIIGVVVGANAIPSKWKEPIGDDFKMGWGIINLKRENRLSVLAKETCEIGIAMTKQGNEEIKIMDTPPLARQIETNPPLPRVELEMDYCGLPAIGYEEDKKINVLIHNNLTQSFNGELQLEGPKDWQIEPSIYPVRVPGSTHRAFSFSLWVPKSIEEMGQINELKATLFSGEKEVSSTIFGIAGKRIWTVLGPFWTTIDPFFVDEAIIDEALSDYEYLPEPDIDRVTPGSESNVFFERKIIQAGEDRIDLDAIFGMKGPAVLYLLSYLKSPEERDIWLQVGSSDGIKIWINGKQVLSSRSHRFSMVFNSLVQTKLKRGINKIVVRIARCSGSYGFRFGIKESKHNRESLEKLLQSWRKSMGEDMYEGQIKHRWILEQWGTDLASIPPWVLKPA